MTVAKMSDNKPLKNTLPDTRALGLVNTCRFKVRTIEDVEVVAQFAAHIFGDPSRIQPGLQALMLNAVEHGCLGVGGELKAQLMEQGTWADEIRRRQSLPENRQRFANIIIARKKDGIYTVIQDPGQGFDWRKWLSVDPTRANLSYGRGIALARSMSFDGLTYNPAGNQVVAHSRDMADIEW
ncbi:MAG: ATP-binding protein [Alphaproteobacteria bacterium]|nr:ATP-binding protein [Alphaproteobacteria bacterium]